MRTGTIYLSLYFFLSQTLHIIHIFPPFSSLCQLYYRYWIFTPLIIKPLKPSNLYLGDSSSWMLKFSARGTLTNVAANMLPREPSQMLRQIFSPGNPHKSRGKFSARGTLTNVAANLQPGEPSLKSRQICSPGNPHKSGGKFKARGTLKQVAANL